MALDKINKTVGFKTRYLKPNYGALVSGIVSSVIYFDLL